MAIFSERLRRALDELSARQRQEWAALSPARRLAMVDDMLALAKVAGTLKRHRPTEPLEEWSKILARLRKLAAAPRPA